MKGLVFALSVFTLSGCTVGPDYFKIDLSSPNAISAGKAGSVLFAQQTQVKWWENFNDPIFNDLILAGLQDNPDIRMAAARVEEARAMSGEARAGLLPQIGANAQAQRQRSSSNRAGTFPGEEPFTAWDYQTGFDASWEIDLFGGRRRALEAAKAQTDATRGQWSAAQLSIAAEIARSYVNLRTLQNRLNIAKARSNALDKIVSLTQKQVKLGSAPESTNQQARAAFLSSKAIQSDLSLATEQQIHALAVLTGKQPDALVGLLSDENHPIPSLSIPPEIAYPAAALQVRPDVFAAERTLAAANAQIGVATAQLYPKIILTGNGGFLSAETDTLFERNSLTGSFVPQISLPIFSGGAIRAQIKAADARTRQALSAFDKSILNALLEIHDGIAALRYAEEKEQILKDAALSAQGAASAIEKRYALGAENLLNVLEIKQNVFEAQDGAAMAKAEAILASIALFKATAGAPLKPNDIKQDANP